MRLLLLLALFLVSCSGGPNVVVHIANHAEQGFDYANRDNTIRGFKPYSDTSTDKLLCLSEGDARALLDWSKAQCRKP